MSTLTREMSNRLTLPDAIQRLDAPGFFHRCQPATTIRHNGHDLKVCRCGGVQGTHVTSWFNRNSRRFPLLSYFTSQRY